MRLTGTIAAVALLGGSCDSSVSDLLAPEPGTLIVLIASTGNSPDVDGYQLTVDDREPIPVDGNDHVVIPGLTPGNHTVGLTGFADACVVTGPTVRTISIRDNHTTSTYFGVTCGWLCEFEYPYCVRLGSDHAYALKP